LHLGQKVLKSLYYSVVFPGRYLVAEFIATWLT